MSVNSKLLIVFALTMMAAVCGTSTAQAQTPARIGDTMVLQYTFSGIDQFALQDAETGAEIRTSIVNEIQRRNTLNEKLTSDWHKLERAASRAESLNPLLKNRGRRAVENQGLLVHLIEQNQKALAKLSEIAEFSRGKSRLTAAQLKKLSSFMFVEEIKLTKKSDYLRFTARQEELRNSMAAVHVGEPLKPTTLLARGVRILRTKWGVLAVGALGSFAISGYEMYANSKAEKAESDYYLVYDDRIVAQ